MLLKRHKGEFKDKFDKEGLKVKWSNWQEEGTQAEYVNSMEIKNEQQEQ